MTGCLIKFWKITIFVFLYLNLLAKTQRYQNVEVFVDDVLVTKTSASLRVPDDYIIRIPISQGGKVFEGKSLKLQWPRVSVSVATLEVDYNEGKIINKIFVPQTLLFLV